MEIAHRKNLERKSIALVDMHSADGPNGSDLVDGTHPNDLGYQKMATIWHRGIREASSKGFLSVPGADVSRN